MRYGRGDSACAGDSASTAAAASTIAPRSRACTRPGLPVGTVCPLFPGQSKRLERELRDAEPFVLLLTELLPGLVELLERGVLRRLRLVELECRLVGGAQQVTRERMQLDAVRDQALQCNRVLGIVLRLHLDMGLGGGRLDHLLID